MSSIVAVDQLISQGDAVNDNAGMIVKHLAIVTNLKNTYVV